MYFLRSQQVSYVNNSLHTPYSPCNYNVLDCKDQKRPIDDEIIKYTIASEDSHLPIKLSMLKSMLALQGICKHVVHYNRDD